MQYNKKNKITQAMEACKMMFTPRPYQQKAIDLAIAHVMKCFDPALLVLGCGAGKSIVLAEIAKAINLASNKKVLCLAPSRELTIQNRKKYLSTGNPASIFSASAGGKCIENDVVFGTPKTVMNSIEKFGNQFAAVALDEAHTLSNTVLSIIASMKEKNPNLRVIGMTATPYRMNTGYIYQMDENNKPVGDDKAINPFFKKKLFEISEYELMDMGFLTRLTTSVTKTCYDTSSLEMKGSKYTQESLDRVFTEDQRITHEIIEQVIEATKYRRGVMLFAATIQHAEEMMRSLPAHNSAIVTGNTKAKERSKALTDTECGRVKFLVSVGALTTGVDLPIVDTIAVLRPTESQSLFLQIMGRGTRLFDGKHDCLIMDFANNIENHGLEDNLFKPTINVHISSSEKHRVSAQCECCGFENDFGGRPNKNEFKVDQYGYFVDLMGEQIIDDETKKPYPAHFGRRCENHEFINGSFQRCSGRWSFKACPHCEQENDIAAKYCCSCKGELIDPNEKLRLDFKKIKRSPYEATSDRIISWFAQHHKVVKDPTKIKLKIEWKTEFRTFDAYYGPEQQYTWVPLCRAVFGRVVNNVDEFIQFMRQGMGKMPETITSSKNKGARFVKIVAYNQPEDLDT